MTVLAWLGHALSATAWFAFNLVVASGLYLLSAFVATQPDGASGAMFIRGLATFWLYIAAWTWLVRGILARPAPPYERNRKPTGAEMARRSVGCLANLVPIPFVFWFVGGFADRTWAGLTGPDPSDPAKLAAGRLQSLVYYAIDHGHEWVPGLIAAFFALAIFRIVRGAGQARRRRGSSVESANAQTLARLRSRNKASQPRAQGVKKDTIDQASRVASAPPKPTPGAGRHDGVLGQLSWSSAESAWWAQRPDGFPVLVAGSADGPEASALTQAHQVVQRSFEVLLRASEAARAEAQGRGVGLPRFTIAAAHVSGKEARLHLRCDADATHDYVVRSTDGLHTFRAGA